jgi:hypothetical protein
MGRILTALLATALPAVALAAPAAASTVRANPEATGTRVSLTDGGGRANSLEVSVPAEAREIHFRDAASRVRPAGKNCTRVRPSRVDCALEGELFFEVEVDTGAGDDLLRSRIADRYRAFTQAVVHLSGGPGDDVIRAGGAEDTIDAGPGRDRVRAGRGYDFIAAGPADDGPDLYDGGRQGATVSYAERESPVRVKLDGLPNDGETGEGDNLHRAFGATGGTAGDRLLGDRHRNYLFGAAGKDLLRGRGNVDFLSGEQGSDRLLAGPGDDWVLDRGTGGVDIIDCGPGRDLYEADARDIVTRCEIPLFGSRAQRTTLRLAEKR